MMNELIAEIQLDKAEFSEPMSPPASTNELELLRKDAAQRLGYTVPEAYIHLLQITDGIDVNGIQLYASHAQTQITPEGRKKYLFRGLVEANEQWREFEPNKQYVFFAESGGELYCHNLTTGKFEIVDRITKELIYAPSSFGTCEELLETMLNHMLDRYGEDPDE